jgi:hypothetical protein
MREGSGLPCIGSATNSARGDAVAQRQTANNRPAVAQEQLRIADMGDGRRRGRETPERRALVGYQAILLATADGEAAEPGQGAVIAVDPGDLGRQGLLSMIASGDAQPDGRQRQVQAGQDVFALRQLAEFKQPVDLFDAGIGCEVRKIVFCLAEAFGQEIKPPPAILWQWAERLKADLRRRAKSRGASVRA